MEWEWYLSSYLTLGKFVEKLNGCFETSAVIVITKTRACRFRFSSSGLSRQSVDLSQWHFWSQNVFLSCKMQEYPSWSITPARLDPRWSDRVHNTPCVWQPRIVEWLKLMQRQCSVITELPVSSPWSFRVNQSQSLISRWRCTQGPTKRDTQYRGEDRHSHVFTPAFQFH